MSFDAILSGLKEQDIIPEVLPANFAPSTPFFIKYSSESAEVKDGQELVREQTLEEPEILFPSKVDLAGTYTLVMTDPDAPSRKEPKYRQFRHWVITGIEPPSAASSSEVETSSLLAPAKKTKPSTTPYRPPGPPPGSGYHRYTFALFREPAGGITIPEGAKEYGAELEQRRSWNAVQFGEQYGLELVGASYFLVKGADA